MHGPFAFCIGCSCYGIPEYEAKLYADYLNKVHATTSDESAAAKKALEAAGAHDLKVTSEVAA